MDRDCAVITPSDPAPASSRAGGLTMVNKRVMPYCVTLLCGNVACMMGAESGGSGYYSAVNPQLQVDLLNTTSMQLSAGAHSLALPGLLWRYVTQQMVSPVSMELLARHWRIVLIPYIGTSTQTERGHIY